MEGKREYAAAMGTLDTISREVHARRAERRAAAMRAAGATAGGGEGAEPDHGAPD